MNDILRIDKYTNNNMKLSSKGRYAVMAMADLASNAKEGPISLTEISIRQNISLAYLEQIFLKLKVNF